MNLFKNSYSLVLGFRVWCAVCASLRDSVPFGPLLWPCVSAHAPLLTLQSFLLSYCFVSHLAFCKGNKTHVWQVYLQIRWAQSSVLALTRSAEAQARPGKPSGGIWKDEGRAMTAGATETGTALAWDPSAGLSYLVGVYRHKTSELFPARRPGSAGWFCEWANECPLKAYIAGN